MVHAHVSAFTRVTSQSTVSFYLHMSLLSQMKLLYLTSSLFNFNSFSFSYRFAWIFCTLFNRPKEWQNEDNVRETHRHTFLCHNITIPLMFLLFSLQRTFVAVASCQVDAKERSIHQIDCLFMHFDIDSGVVSFSSIQYFGQFHYFCLCCTKTFDDKVKYRFIRKISPMFFPCLFVFISHNANDVIALHITTHLTG